MNHVSKSDISKREYELRKKQIADRKQLHAIMGVRTSPQKAGSKQHQSKFNVKSKFVENNQ